MKTLRYLLMVISLASVMVVRASAPSYGKPYYPSKELSYQGTQVQMPKATMSSTGTAIMHTGSSLPMAAVEGVTTTIYGGPRHAKKEDPDPNPFGGETVEGTENPLEPGTPIGDAALPLMLLAAAYALLRAFRRRQARE